MMSWSNGRGGYDEKKNNKNLLLLHCTSCAADSSKR
jgi:hypothetical protein